MKGYVFIIGDIMLETWGEVEDLPHISSSANILNINQFIGGMAVNSAFALSSLGIESYLFSTFGKNVPKNKIDSLKGIGINLSFSKKTQGYTPIVYAFFNQDKYHHYYFSTQECCDELLLTAHILKKVSKAHYVLFSGSHASFYKKLYLELLNFLPKEKVLFSPSYSLYSYKIDELKQILTSIDYLLLNENETKWICNQLNVEARNLNIYGPRFFIKTENSKGSTIFSKAEIIKIPPIPTTVRNGIGAGDAFNSGFIFGLVNNFSLEQCGQIGNILGSLCVAQPEVQIATTKEVIEDIYEKYYNCNF